MASGYLLGGQIIWAGDDLSLLGMGVGLGVGIILHWILFPRLLRSQVRKQQAARGLPQNYALTIEVGDELVRAIGGIAQHINWSCISELFPAGNCWVFLAQFNPIYVPKKLFADAAAERQFLAESLAHMTPSARRRSAQAQKLAGLVDEAHA
jgi:hypothetical protein